MNRAKADILIEVVWNINTMGPKRSVTYTLRGWMLTLISRSQRRKVRENLLWLLKWQYCWKKR